MHDSSHIELRKRDRMVELILNRPEKKNALTQAMYATLARGLREADQDDDVRVVLISGHPDIFCGGNDIADFAGTQLAHADVPVLHFLEALREMAKPLVAAVRGPAVGIGTTLLLHCDLVYAGIGATFQLPFVNLGLCPEAGSSYLLPRVAGLARASEFLLLGEPFSGAKALGAGLVTALHPDEEVYDAALDAARKLASQPPEALRLTKRLLREPHGDTLARVMETELEVFRGRLSSPEAREAFAAFLEKRPPDFSSFR